MGMRMKSMIINSNNPLVQNSTAIDFEWIPFDAAYSHDKTRITSAAFCTSEGKRIVLHISMFKEYPNPERKLIKRIIDILNRFNLTFGWYSTGVRNFNTTKGKFEGHYSDLFLLHQRCIYYGIENLSPIALGARSNTPYFKDDGKKHIDLYKVYSKEIIKNGVFNKKYRTDRLDDVAQSLLGIGKYSYKDPITDAKIIVTGENVNDLPFEIQMRYVARDAELTMMLAYHNDCLALEIMKYIAFYSEMDYYRCCHSGVSQWYANIYKNMINRRECLFEYDQGKKISQVNIVGGNSVQPKKGFYKNQPIDELDIKGMYPTIAIEHNISFETVNCQCCQNDPELQVPSEVMDEINNSLLQLKEETRSEPYWICRRIKGAFPTKLQDLIRERDNYQTLLKEESDPVKLIQYNARQMALKLLANAGYGVFAMETFDFSDYRVSELITGYGRLIHKELQKIALEKYGLETVFGFTDSIFIKNASLDTIEHLILECKEKHHVTLEHKNRYINTIIFVFDKKNRFVAWTGNSADKPILKNLDGMSGRYPKWIKQNIAKIATHIISSDDHNGLELLIDQAFHELESGKVSYEDLAFVAKLSKEPEEYRSENNRMKVLAMMLGAQKGDIVRWYETLPHTSNTRTFSIKPENLNLEKYKTILFSKLNDILEITGQLSRAKTIPVNKFRSTSIDNRQPALDDFIKNFPLRTPRDKQAFVLDEIATAIASGYKYILLEAPTGFGKSPVAMTVALTLGTSYICTSTKDLQTQYARDFPFLKVAKGKNNFICAVKEDSIRNGTHRCGLCVSNNTNNECNHTSADYGPCMNNEDFRKGRCKYRTFSSDYQIENKGTTEEKVFIDCHSEQVYRDEYSQWSYAHNLKEELRILRPCEYYHQLNVALTSSHSVLNYSMLLVHLAKPRGFPSRELLVLDEVHLLETEIVEFRAISISKRRWKRYIPYFKIVDYGHHKEKWIDFLTELETKMFDLIGNVSEELSVEAVTDIEKLQQVLDNMRSNPKNWIVNEIKKENNEVTSVEFKPLDISPYCKNVFQICNKILMMSATILDKEAFCASLGLATEEVKFIQVPSDFPLQNRPIHPLNTAYLNSDSLQQQEVQIKIARAIDNLMTLHRNDKGIIHTTSYKQLDFIKENISHTNKCRLLETSRIKKIQRDEVIAEHLKSTEPTVLISPSLYTGLDLKDDLSRFQIITKVPYPDISDRWINEKRKMSGQWYNWQTALRLVQGYGRSIRSREDWAKTYVLDSGFENFVWRNKNILPDWFTQAIVVSLGHAGFNSKVPTTTKENHNRVTHNQHTQAKCK
jgi:ATP-dependent DNA helicase DinG